MRCSVNFLALILAVASTSNAQNQNFGNPNQNFGNQNFIGNTHFSIYQDYEENDLSAEKFFFFDIDLLKEILHDQPEGNILISPLSIKSVLAMILEGASNETADELRMALRLPNNKKVREQFQKLLVEFERPKGGVNLQMANRVFMSTKKTPLDAYRNILTQYYHSNVTQVDFSSPVQSANTINSWVNEKTHGIIPTLVDEGSFGGEISILLANALYFKGMWEKAFSELGTKTNCFFLSSGKCQMSPMMDVVDNFKYDEVKKLDAKVIELPYTGGEYSMVIVLPNNRNGIRQLSRDIRDSINSIVQNMNETEVFITLPRFKIDYNTDLVTYLPRVHINRILGPQAQLNEIVADTQVRVSNVLHKAFIEVNEQGTIAAAATGAVVIPLMGTTKPRFKADHPFLFFIRHTATGTILFEGRLSVPESSYIQQNPQQNPQQGSRQPQQQPGVQQQGNRQPQQQPGLQQQGNRQPVQQPSLQRPGQPQPTFLSNTQDSFNPTFEPQLQPQNSFQTPQQNFQAQQSSFQTPPNFQNQPQFQNLPQNVYQQEQQHQQPQQQQQSQSDSTRDLVRKHIPNIFAYISHTRQPQQVQSDDANVNGLRTGERPKTSYTESENTPIVYEQESNGKHRQ